MKTYISDKRSALQTQQQKFAVVAIDKFMSGWGMAEGGLSYCAWAFCGESTSPNANAVLQWVKSRGDMRRVRIVYLPNYRPPSECAHFSIYGTHQTHRAFTGVK